MLSIRSFDFGGWILTSIFSNTEMDFKSGFGVFITSRVVTKHFLAVKLILILSTRLNWSSIVGQFKCCFLASDF